VSHLFFVGLMVTRHIAPGSAFGGAEVSRAHARTESAARTTLLAPIEVGDLLTTSGTEGHAMKASDAGCTLGSILGKALAPLSEGRGLIPVLVALH